MIWSHPMFCPVCGQHRNRRVHGKCSRKLQKLNQKPEVIAERNATLEGERTYNRSIGHLASNHLYTIKKFRSASGGND